MKLTTHFPENRRMQSGDLDNHLNDEVVIELLAHFGPERIVLQSSRMGIPVVWVPRESLKEVIAYLQCVSRPYVMLYDLHGVDERLRQHRDGLPASDFTLFYHLVSIERNSDVMLKVALMETDLVMPSITDLFANANWYEREVWDLLGITFSGHPHLSRIMMPKSWKGHPLRKDYPARATEQDPFMLDIAKQDMEQEASPSLSMF